MLNAVGVYVQTGMTWQQVPSRPVGEAGSGVIKLTDAYTYDVLFTPEVTGWAELIPGYMHVRIQSDMLISRSAQPGNDIVERRTPFYVYLKPHGANDADIKARGKMSGHAAGLHPDAAALIGHFSELLTAICRVKALAQGLAVRQVLASVSVPFSPGGFAMSKSEVERFAKDLKTKPALLADIVARGSNVMAIASRPTTPRRCRTPSSTRFRAATSR